MKHRYDSMSYIASAVSTNRKQRTNRDSAPLAAAETFCFGGSRSAPNADSNWAANRFPRRAPHLQRAIADQAEEVVVPRDGPSQRQTDNHAAECRRRRDDGYTRAPVAAGRRGLEG